MTPLHRYGWEPSRLSGMDFLRNEFPVFRSLLPLALSVRQELEWAGGYERGVPQAMAAYTSSPAYLRIILVGATRYNLWGKPHGEVKDHEMWRAKIRLREMGEPA